MNRKIRIASIFAALVVVVGVGISVFAFPRHPVISKATAHAVTSTKDAPLQPLSLSNRERTLSSKQAARYHAIPVINEAGKPTTLDVSKHPVVFVSTWDLTMLHQFVGQQFASDPTLAVAWPNPKQTLQEELKQVALEAKKLHLTNPIVALDAKNPRQWVTGIPDTYVWQKHHIVEIPGPLPPNEVHQWTQVFK
ncbi:hypothetical protein LLE49_22105 [Alicyclobacillus tolerans]|uniref:hypothetical protein n=1 Tax=Alicyclobacillus tolerans TaxID=90970 RepID=UPI001F24A8B5|nr:hypothetical protein [Alicyclobacillus tolerans]MCF8567418.1 hypothetical protein [Alicyclobacillus tolerans]